jgi:hypothetical protein
LPIRTSRKGIHHMKARLFATAASLAGVLAILGGMVAVK